MRKQSEAPGDGGRSSREGIRGCRAPPDGTKSRTTPPHSFSSRGAPDASSYTRTGEHQESSTFSDIRAPTQIRTVSISPTPPPTTPSSYTDVRRPRIAARQLLPPHNTLFHTATSSAQIRPPSYPFHLPRNTAIGRVHCVYSRVSRTTIPDTRSWSGVQPYCPTFSGEEE